MFCYEELLTLHVCGMIDQVKLCSWHKIKNINTLVHAVSSKPYTTRKRAAEFQSNTQLYASVLQDISTFLCTIVKANQNFCASLFEVMHNLGTLWFFRKTLCYGIDRRSCTLYLWVLLLALNRVELHRSVSKLSPTSLSTITFAAPLGASPCCTCASCTHSNFAL